MIAETLSILVKAKRIAEELSKIETPNALERFDEDGAYTLKKIKMMLNVIKEKNGGILPKKIIVARDVYELMKIETRNLLKPAHKGKDIGDGVLNSFEHVPIEVDDEMGNGDIIFVRGEQNVYREEPKTKIEP